MNKCVECGKFRKWEDLQLFFTPDNHFSEEESFRVCKFCKASELTKKLIEQRRKQDQEWLKKNLGMF